MRRFLLLLLVSAVPFSCRRDDRPAAPLQARVASNASSAEGNAPSPETFALGPRLTREGAVPAEAAGESFVRGGPVYLSIDVTSASGSQMIEVQWSDAGGRVLRRAARVVPKGTRYAPFSSGSTSEWSPGAHRAIVAINGRVVSKRTFAML